MSSEQRDDTHDIYRDWLAVTLGADTGVRVDEDLMQRTNILRVEANGKASIVEVLVLQATGSTNFQTVLGQLSTYPEMYEDQLGNGPVIGRRVYCVVSHKFSERRGQLKQLNRFRELHPEVDIETVTARPSFPPEYNIGGFVLARPCARKALTHEQIALIKDLFQATGRITQASEDFLFEICQRWFLLRGVGACVGVHLVEGEMGVAVYARSNASVIPVNLVKAVDAWFRLEHYAWLQSPQFVGVSQ